MRIGVILAGCGVFDGSEIHEAVLSLLAIRRHGGDYHCFAPDQEQADTIDHKTGVMVQERRQVLVESARIARGMVSPLSECDINSLDGLLLPGGFGAAKNLSNYATCGEHCEIQRDVARIVLGCFQEKKPIAALCIAPVILGRLISQAEITVGRDTVTMQALREMGAMPKSVAPGHIHVDHTRRLITAPCYMYDSPLEVIDQEINQVVATLAQLLG